MRILATLSFISLLVIGGFMIFDKSPSKIPGILANSSISISTGPEVSDIDKTTLFKDTNDQRKRLNLPALKKLPALEKSAMAKCKDLVKRNYWGHNTPDGKEPWIFFKNIDYIHAGENLAYGWHNAETTVNGWMLSPTHKANIVNTDYDYVGYAVCKSENFVGSGTQLITVQHFADL